MPGMPIFQDSPSQLKGQIYVVDKDDNNKVVPLSVDNSGSLSTSLAAGTTVGLATGATVGLTSGTTVGLTSGATVGLASGTTVGLASGATVGLATGTVVGLEAGTDIDTVSSVTTVGTVTNDVKIVNGTTALTTSLASGTTVGLTSGTTVGLASGTTVGLTSGTEVGLATGATVGLATGANVIGKVQNDLVFTNVDSFGGATPLVAKTITASSTVNSNSQNISKESSYNWFIKNEGTASTQDITLKVQLSPDGGTNWIDDTGISISVPNGTSKMITVNNFLQNARFVITGGSADTTVISCFQAQH